MTSGLMITSRKRSFHGAGNLGQEDDCLARGRLGRRVPGFSVLKDTRASSAACKRTDSLAAVSTVERSR
jgi:hypothetical protein